MHFPLTTNFIYKGSGERVSGLIEIAIDQHLLLWTGWRYRDRDEDRTWDWWSIYVGCGSPGARCECYAALAGNELQGLMALDLEGGGLEPAKELLLITWQPTRPTGGRVTDLSVSGLP